MPSALTSLPVSTRISARSGGRLLCNSLSIRSPSTLTLPPSPLRVSMTSRAWTLRNSGAGPATTAGPTINDKPKQTPPISAAQRWLVSACIGSPHKMSSQPHVCVSVPIRLDVTDDDRLDVDGIFHLVVLNRPLGEIRVDVDQAAIVSGAACVHPICLLEGCQRAGVARLHEGRPAQPTEADIH